MLHSMAHWQKTVHGYSGLRPPAHAELYRYLRSFPDDESLDRLAAMGVTYVVVHPGLYGAGQWPPVDARLRRFEGRLQLVHADGADLVFRLR
jgi:hypothetical protein